MNIFGFNIERRSTRDKVIVRSVVPASIPIAKIPRVKPAALNYGQTFTYGGRGHFSHGEYDLSEIGKIEDTDSFVRQAFKKKLGLMFKEGISYSGANKDTIRYVKTRLAQIARASDIPTLDLLKRTGHSLIRTSNAFWIKVRNRKASGGQKRVTADGKKLDAVAAYFPAAPETMKFEIDPNSGKVVKWRQMLPDGYNYKDFRPEDVVHFCIDRREGFILGVPSLVPVIDDVRALRQIEENVELLVYQYLFPLFHYKVGTENAPAGWTEDGYREIDIVKDQIELMPSEGALVTPERHEITAIGAEGRSLRAESYLEHFKKRVFAGLGVSQVDMGDGDTTNRATAQTMSRALIDTVKDIQDAFESQFDHLIVDELLLESTFGQDVLEDENRVHIQFREIDIQNKMELQQHNLEMFKGNALTWDELRAEMGYEPIKVPEDPQDQDPSKYPEFFNTYFELFEKPLTLIRAVDEPYSLAAKMAAEARTMGTTTGDIATAKKEQEERDKKSAAEDRKTKVAVAKARPRATSNDSLLTESFSLLEKDTVERVKSNLATRGHINVDILVANGRTWAVDVTEKMVSLAMTRLISGLNDQTGFQAGSPNAIHLVGLGREQLYKRISFFVERLTDSVIALVQRRVDSMVGDVTINNTIGDVSREVHIAFDAVRFRTRFIWDVELRKAYNFGRVLGMRLLGHTSYKLVAANGACDACQALDGQIVNIATVGLDDVPPLHPHSRMKMELADGLSNVPTKEKGKAALQQPDPSLERQTAVCPKCGHSAVLQPRSGTYFCHRCNMAYSKAEVNKKTKQDEDLTDGEKMESCVMQVKAKLRKKNPGMGEKEIKSRAFAICTAQLKKG